MSDETKTPWFKRKPILFRIGLWLAWGLGIFVWARVLRNCQKDKDRADLSQWELGADPTTLDFAVVGSFWAGIVTLAVWLVLLATRNWWFRWAGRKASFPDEKSSYGLKINRLSWIPLVAVLVFAALLRGPMMDRPVLRDEQDNLRRNIFGYHYVELHHRDIRFLEAEWRDAFFENRLANNPVFFSVLSKASLTIWHQFSGAPEDQFNPVALRMPSLIFGLGSILMLFLFVNLLNRPFAALLASFLAAIHPLHIEYSVQARGYGIVMFFVGVAAVCGVLAMRKGNWRYFLGFALSLLGILYAFAGALYFILPTGLAMGIPLVWRWIKNRNEASTARLTRFVISGIIAGTIYTQLIAPSLPQISAHLGGKYEHIPLHPRWLMTTVHQYTTGIWVDDEVHDQLQAENIDAVKDPWFKTFGGVWRYHTDNFFPNEPLHTLLIFGLFPFFTVVGFVSIWRMGPTVRWFAVAGAIAPFLDFSHHHFITHLYAYFWYWIYSLLWLFAFVAVGISSTGWWLAEKCKSKDDLRPVFSTGVAVLFFGIYLVETMPSKENRFQRAINPPTKKLVFPRGKSDWVIYPNGYQLRVREGEEIPESFSGLDS